MTGCTTKFSLVYYAMVQHHINEMKGRFVTRDIPKKPFFIRHPVPTSMQQLPCFSPSLCVVPHEGGYTMYCSVAWRWPQPAEKFNVKSIHKKQRLKTGGGN